MADTDEVVLDESTPEDGPGSDSPDLDAKTQDAVHETVIELWAILGTTPIQIHNLLRMGRGAVIELEQTSPDPLEIRVNTRLIARGEIVVVDDRLGVCITENVTAETVRQRG